MTRDHRAVSSAQHAAPAHGALLATVRADELVEPGNNQRWMVESLWMRAGVGIIGGAPKCCKSWLGLDLAVSVATGSPGLGHFAVHDPGPVVLYLAEDAPSAIKQRLQGICRHRGLSLHDAPLHVITEPVLRLDIERDQSRLESTLAALRPRMLLLDPFVRLHRIDENSAAEVSALLAFLRELQRRYDVAIVVTHHTRKQGGAGSGQSLRGSGDFHAWTDSALYVHRQRDAIAVTLEHRSAPVTEPLMLGLISDNDGSAYLELVQHGGDGSAGSDLTERILSAIDSVGGVASRDMLRSALRIRNERLGPALTQLRVTGHLEHDERGWRRPVPVPP